ncbi:MAG TPA: methyltransferase domain-containing protein [Armatimonadaceae bacterium]|nr:methyltransferase domain-containing protein [Armatimonadaceae bacterium]
MDEPTARYLTSPPGEELLARVAALSGDAAARVLALRRKQHDLAPEIAAAAVAVSEARRRAARRFPDADRLFFTPDALAQATSPTLAAYHARVLAPYGDVADLCCGVGVDAIALAEAGAKVTALDIDPARLAFAEANARARGVAGRIRFLCADATTFDPGGVRAAFLDPARRTAADGGGGRRVSRHGEQYAPPLSFASEFAGRVEALGVKLSPALPDEILLSPGGSVRFLSEARECKEAFVLCRRGAPSSPAGPSADVAALLLPEEVVLPATEEPAPVGPVGAYLLDPDPAVLRAGALGSLCARLGSGARRISYGDGYLTADARPPETRAASVYRVLEALPYRPRVVGEWLRARGIGRLVVKKRRFPKEPDAVARELKLSGRGDEGTLVLVQESDDSFLAVLCEPAGLAVAAASPD